MLLSEMIKILKIIESNQGDLQCYIGDNSIEIIRVITNFKKVTGNEGSCVEIDTQ